MKIHRKLKHKFHYRTFLEYLLSEIETQEKNIPHHIYAKFQAEIIRIEIEVRKLNEYFACPRALFGENPTSLQPIQSFQPLQTLQSQQRQQRQQRQQHRNMY